MSLKMYKNITRMKITSQKTKIIVNRLYVPERIFYQTGSG